MTEQEAPPSAAAPVPRAVLIMLGAAAATLTIAGLKSISSIAAPAFLALMLTIGVHPMRGWLQRKGAPTWVATICVVVTVYLLLVALFMSLVVSVGRLATLLPQYRDDLSQAVDAALAWLGGLGVGPEQIDVVTRALDPGQLVGYVAALLDGLLGVVSNLFFLVTLLLFLAIDAAWFPHRLSEAVEERGGVVAALQSFARGTRRYLVVSTIFGLIVAVLDVGLLYLLAIPLPLLWGLLAFITNYIPNIGFVIGVVPPAILGLLEQGLSGLAGVLIGYSVVNVVIQSFIQPKFVGDAVGLSTSLTFISLVFWAWVFGALGALLAIPLSLLTKALLVDSDPNTAWLRPLLAGGVTAPAKPSATPEPARVPSLRFPRLRGTRQRPRTGG
jgi:AI-2 transport protein TqsA